MSSSDFSIVRADRFIEATRSSGYEGTARALAELIDNAIQAEAKNIDVRFIDEPPEEGQGRRRKPRVKHVVITDDGLGMDAETIRRALRFGDGTRFNDRTGLGRFGMGLPNASVSQCRRVDIYSWTRSSKPLWTYLDVNEVASGAMEWIPEPTPKDIPSEFAPSKKTASGTVIIWSDCTDLDCEGIGESIAKKVRPEFGRIYRYPLASKLRIVVDGVAVRPIDPLYLMPEARLDGDPLAEQHGETLKFPIPIPGKDGQTSTIEVTFSLLPRVWQENWGGHPKKEQKAEMRRRQIPPQNQCVSIVRAGREIDFVPDLYRVQHWTARWYKAEIRFQPDLDECFQITHTKQHARVRLGSVLDNIIKKTVDANLSTLKDKVQRLSNQRKNKSDEIGQAEKIVKKAESQLKPNVDLQDKPERKVRAEVEDYVERLVQMGTPVEQIAQTEHRLSEFPVVKRTEFLPGAPFYRVETVGRSTVVYLNTHHVFYNALYRRLEEQSPEGQVGLELLIMALARCEAMGSDECRRWYENQRQEWSQAVKAYLEQLPEFEPGSGDDTASEIEEVAA